MKRQENNPLRISQESLDLDDIISDLNSESHHSVVQQPGNTVVQPAPQVSNMISQPIVKTVAPSATTGKIQESKAVYCTQAQGSKGVKAKDSFPPKKVNKENDPGLLNKQTSMQNSINEKQGKQVMPALESVRTNADQSTLHETKGAMSESQNQIGNQGYADTSNLKSSTIQGDHDEEDNTRMTSMPFYLKGAQQLASDEDVESFQRKLDTMIVNFRSETLSEFMKTKKQVLSDQAQTIDAERRRCNTLLGVKQNEIEVLKESLASKTKHCESLGIRCEGMAFWAGKAKILLKIKLLQHQAFTALRSYRDFKKHSKRVMEHKLRQYRERLMRDVFQGWGRLYKEWKIVKNREDFDKAVKLELQHICAQYNKEIESLRDRLNEAQAIVENEHRHKAMMQENLKKAFMRGVCALNFEAMNILNPNDQNYQQQIEKEMEKQVMHAMNSVAQQSPFTYDTTAQQRVNIPVRPPLFQSAASDHLSPSSSFEQEGLYQEHKMMNLDSAQQVNPFSQNMSEGSASTNHDLSYQKIESKDSMWKPAPIMGRDLTQQHIVPSFTYNQPTSITSQLNPQSANQGVVLSSTFNKLAGNQQTYAVLNADLVQVTTKEVSSCRGLHRLEEDTEKRFVPGNHATIINHQGNNSLPDFVSVGAQSNFGGEGRVINANLPQSAQSKGVGAKNAYISKKPTTTVAPSSALSKKK